MTSKALLCQRAREALQRKIGVRKDPFSILLALRIPMPADNQPRNVKVCPGWIVTAAQTRLDLAKLYWTDLPGRTPSSAHERTLYAFIRSAHAGSRLSGPSVQVAEAFKKARRQWHPDRHRHATLEQQAHAEEMFKLLSFHAPK